MEEIKKTTLIDEEGKVILSSKYMLANTIAKVQYGSTFLTSSPGQSICCKITFHCGNIEDTFFIFKSKLIFAHAQSINQNPQLAAIYGKYLGENQRIYPESFIKNVAEKYFIEQLGFSC